MSTSGVERAVGHRRPGELFLLLSTYILGFMAGALGSHVLAGMRPFAFFLYRIVILICRPNHSSHASRLVPAVIIIIIITIIIIIYSKKK